MIVFFSLIINNLSFALVYLGNLNTNQFDPYSIHNKFGVYGNPFNALSINNNFGRYGSQFSNYSVNNPFAVFPPKLYDQNGVYMGKLSANKFDPDAISNPCSIYLNMVRYATTVIGIYGE